MDISASVNLFVAAWFVVVHLLSGTQKGPQSIPWSGILWGASLRSICCWCRMPLHRLTRACCGGLGICLGLGAAGAVLPLTGADIWLTFGFDKYLLNQAQDELPLSI